MYKITKKRLLTDNIYLMDIEAPRVARSAKPGQFIIIRNTEKGERIPLTIADYDAEEGTVTIVFQTVGASTKELATFEEGEYVQDFVGPLGTPSEFVKEDFLISQSVLLQAVEKKKQIMHIETNFFLL